MTCSDGVPLGGKTYFQSVPAPGQGRDEDDQLALAHL